jgi:2-oxoglutarate ferredoxin oxidoreductase subunit delta
VDKIPTTEITALRDKEKNIYMGDPQRTSWEFRMEEVKKKKEKAKIDIYKAWCKACGICVAFCPTGALAKDEAGYPYVKDFEKCINCGWCEIRCPDFAITVQQKKQKKTEEAKGEEEKAEPKGSIAARQ